MAEPIANPPDLEVRHRFRPGDIGRLVTLHGTIYAAEWGWDHTFEAYVAGPLAEFALRSNERERVWLVDFEGELSASVAIVQASALEARLRWLLISPRLRGRGLGRRLVEEAVSFARSCGYSSVFLSTVKELAVAGRLYDSIGFRVTSEERREIWGGVVTEQRYDLSL